MKHMQATAAATSHGRNIPFDPAILIVLPRFMLALAVQLQQ
jgi:hypothetical protein